MKFLRTVLPIALLLAGAFVVGRMIVIHSNLGTLEYIFSGALLVLLLAAAGFRARRTLFTN
jgi:hypothetical protein